MDVKSKSSEKAKQYRTFVRNEEDIQKYNEFQVRFKIYTTIAATIILGIAAFVTATVEDGYNFAYPLILINFFVFFGGLSYRVSKSKYYSLKSASNENGEHRCIFCGGKGLYKFKGYASHSVKNKCTKCDEILFVYNEY